MGVSSAKWRDFFTIVCAVVGPMVATACSESVAPTIPSPSLTVQLSFEQLRGRAIHIPTISEGQVCPATAATRKSLHGVGVSLGEGPVYPIPGGTVPSGEPFWKVLWVASSSYAGPVLIRGRQLDGSNPILFNNAYDAPISLSVTRTISGRSVAFGPEMDLMETGTPTVPAPGWRAWPSYTYAPTRGCYAWQVDGMNFTEVIVFPAS